jgi:hypothetical protein
MIAGQWQDESKHRSLQDCMGRLSSTLMMKSLGCLVREFKTVRIKGIEGEGYPEFRNKHIPLMKYKINK